MGELVISNKILLSSNIFYLRPPYRTVLSQNRVVRASSVGGGTLRGRVQSGLFLRAHPFRVMRRDVWACCLHTSGLIWIMQENIVTEDIIKAK